MSASAIPVAINFLIDRLELAAADSGSLLFETQIIDGLPSEDVQGSFVAIGLTPEEIVIETERTRSDLTVGQGELVELLGMTRVLMGDTDIRTCRDAAFSLLDGVQAVLLADPSLGGAVGQAWLSRVEYRPRRRRGVQVSVPFFVQVRTF